MGESGGGLVQLSGEYSGERQKPNKAMIKMETSSSKERNADTGLANVKRVVLDARDQGDKLWTPGPDPMAGRTLV